MKRLGQKNAGTLGTVGQSDPAGGGRRRKRLFGLVAVGVGLAASLAVGEAALRLAGYSSPKPYEPDEILGYRLTARVAGDYNKEGRSGFVINSDGFRDVEHAIAKPPNTYRIAVIGDSYVEAFQVEEDQAFTNFIAPGATACGVFAPNQVEVLRFGVSGYSTAQQLLQFREKIRKYSPDLVLLLMTTNNDITDNSPHFKSRPMPFYVFRSDEFVLDNGFRQEAGYLSETTAVAASWRWLYNNLRVFQGIGDGHRAAMLKWKAWRASRRAEELAMPTDATAAPLEIGIDNQIYRLPADEHWENAWRVTERLLLDFRAEVEGSGAKFLVVTGSNGIQVLPKAEEVSDYAKRIGVTDLMYPDRRIAGVAAANGIEHHALVEPLAAYAQAHGVFLHGFEGMNLGYGHWNQLGHKVAGELIAQKLCGK